MNRLWCQLTKVVHILPPIVHIPPGENGSDYFRAVSFTTEPDVTTTDIQMYNDVKNIAEQFNPVSIGASTFQTTDETTDGIAMPVAERNVRSFNWRHLSSNLRIMCN